MVLKGFVLGLLLFGTAVADKVQLIIDTDLGFDVDDFGAIAVAHALADKDLVDIVGIICNTGRDSCIVGVDVVNTYYGRNGTIDIGSFKGKFGSYTDNVCCPMHAPAATICCSFARLFVYLCAMSYVLLLNRAKYTCSLAPSLFWTKPINFLFSRDKMVTT